MKPQTIKSKLVSRGIKQTDIARDILVSRQAVGRVISGKIRSERIQKAVSVALGLPMHRVFPKSGDKQ